MSKFYFLYKTTCIPSNRYYIGMHCTNNLNDGYLGKIQKHFDIFKKIHESIHFERG